MADGIPIVSQVKSIVQLIAGDTEGAIKTQDNFSKRTYPIAQVRSAIEAISGDMEAARETQKEFFRAASDMIDSVPVVGHLKGAIHAVAGDQEGGERAMISATRGTAVALAGTAGFIAGGPVAGGMAAAATGLAVDGAFTAGTKEKHGVFGVPEKQGKEKAGSIVDVVAIPVLDAVMPGVDSMITAKIKPL